MIAAPIHPGPMAHFRALHRMHAQLMAEAFGFMPASGPLHDNIRRDLLEIRQRLRNGEALPQATEVIAGVGRKLLTALAALESGEKDGGVATLYDVAQDLRRCQEIWPELSIVDHAAGCSCCLTHAA